MIDYLPKLARAGGLPASLLISMALLPGCGRSDSSVATTSDLAPPKDRMEGMQRIRQANSDHDKTAPANQRSAASSPRRR